VTLTYVLGGGMNDQPGMGAEFYAAYPVVRRWYEQIEAWTGLTAEQIMHDRLPAAERGFRQGIGTIRQAAMAIGVADVLAELGIVPAVVGGLSLGSMVSACLAGAIDRRSLIELLVRSRDIPPLPRDAPAQGVAVATLPEPGHAALTWWDDVPGAYLAVDLGPVGDGARHLVVLAGYREALERVRDEAPPDTHVHIPRERAIAFHCPLQQSVADFLGPIIEAIPFRAPAIPLCSCLAARTLSTAAEVRELFLRNPVSPVSVAHLRTEMTRHGTRLGLVLGPSQFDRIVRSPFPVVHIETPEHVAEAVSAIYELGVELPTGAPR
jgi:[acyl-carrier-protein] S-malonyltransferase